MPVFSAGVSVTAVFSEGVLVAPISSTGVSATAIFSEGVSISVIKF